MAPFAAWIYNLTNFKSNLFTWTDCKFSFFLYYFFIHFSSALLVIMSVEKFLVLYFPLKTKRICTVKIAKRVVFIAALLYIAFDSQFFFIITENENSYCVFKTVSESYPVILNRIDSVLYSFGPFTIMIITNCAIIYKFLVARYKNSRSGTASTNQALSKSAVRGSLMLVTVTTTFIILTGPASVGFFISKSPHPIVSTTIYLFNYVNHAVNGVLYCVVGSRFRREVMNVLCCHKISRTKSMSSMATSQTNVGNRSSTFTSEQGMASPI